MLAVKKKSNPNKLLNIWEELQVKQKLRKSLWKLNWIKCILTQAAILSAGLYANFYPFKENPNNIRLHMLGF